MMIRPDEKAEADIKEIGMRAGQEPRQCMQARLQRKASKKSFKKTFFPMVQNLYV
jgi:hypothetical protein